MTPHLQRILLATEHTEFDTGAERVAIALAKRWGVGLRVVRPLVSNPEFEALAPAMAEQAAEKAAAGMDALRATARASGVALDVKVRSGEEPWREIVDEASERHTDLLVTRRRGKPSWLARLMVGEMVSLVVKHAPCSVLMVPRAAELWSGHVVAAVDGSPMNERVAQIAAFVATLGNSPLCVISVATDDLPETRAAADASVARAVQAARDAGLAPASTKLLTGRVHERVLEAAGIDGLVVIGQHGTTARIGSAFGGHVHNVVGHAVGPVLVVKV